MEWSTGSPRVVYWRRIILEIFPTNFFHERQTKILFGSLAALFVSASLFFLAEIFFGRTNIFFGSETKEIVPSFSVGTEWGNISIDPPLVPTKRFQRVLVQIPGVVDWKRGSDGIQKLVLKDGAEATVEVQLVDGSGNVENMVPVSFGSLIGFDQGDSERHSAFDPERRFRTLRIRSSVPFEAGPIRWYSWTGK